MNGAEMPGGAMAQRNGYMVLEAPHARRLSLEVRVHRPDSGCGRTENC